MDSDVIQPPTGLFSRIMRRLGLERQLRIVRRHLGFFVGLVVIFTVLSVFALIGLRHVLAGSSFGPYLSLLMSDPGIVLKDWHSFTLSVIESAPGISLFILLIPFTLVLLLLRFASINAERFAQITRLIASQKTTTK